jgi:hypothetical protein
LILLHRERLYGIYNNHSARPFSGIDFIKDFRWTISIKNYRQKKPKSRHRQPESGRAVSGFGAIGSFGGPSARIRAFAGAAALPLRDLPTGQPVKLVDYAQRLS